MNSYFGRGARQIACPPGQVVHRKTLRCRNIRPPKKSLAELQAIALAKEISIHKRRKDNSGFTKIPLSVRALKMRLTRMAGRNPDGSHIPAYFGMATVCPPGYRPNKKWRGKRGQRQCLKGEAKKSLAELRAIARTKGISIYKRRKDNSGFTKIPLNIRALKSRLTRMINNSYQSSAPAYFGMATVCPPNYRPNRKWRGKRGQKQCLKGAPKKSLKQLQDLAKVNSVSIYKKLPSGKLGRQLTAKGLKLRLTRMNISYA